METREILLEAGTNEFEIIQFILDNQSFGINAAKVRDILNYDPSTVSPMPNSTSSVVGLMRLRDDLYPLINLGDHLHLSRGKQSADEGQASKDKIVLVCRFNRQPIAFLVDGVDKIHRLSWSQLSPLSPFLRRFEPRVTATVEINETLVQLLDLEHVVSDLNPSNALKFGALTASAKESEARKNVRIILAEDSAHIRERLANNLRDAGYTSLMLFDNGEDACKKFVALARHCKASGEPLSQHVNLIVSDIEMPQMDGLTFCRKVKKEMSEDVQFILFSSLIDEQMAYKCIEVGADGYITKPEGSQLVTLVNEWVDVDGDTDGVSETHES